MTRVLSGAVLLALAIALVWLAPPPGLFAAGLLLVFLGSNECERLARATGLPLPSYVPAVLAMLACAAVSSAGLGYPPIDLALVMAAGLVTFGALTVASWRSGPHALATAAAGVFPAVYVGIPVGLLVAIRAHGGPGVLFLLMLTIAISDSAQYYTGRALGRRPLAPAISPGKTVEGAIGGFVFGAATLAIGGLWWLPGGAWPIHAAIGLAIVAMGITGDLFESVLKRSAGVKDSSTLIPGHGGILDRIDALIFAAPVYYLLVIA